MGCSMTEGLTRIIVFLANFAVLVVGGALLAIGIIHTIQLNDYSEAIPDDYRMLQHFPILSIGVGALIFLIAVLGCCGALKSNRCRLTVYAGILVAMLLAQVVLGVSAVLQVKNSTDLRDQLNKHLPIVFSGYNRNGTAEVVNVIQQDFQCCGVSGPGWWANASLEIPSSCYPNIDKNATVYAEGCSEALYRYFVSSTCLICTVAIAISGY